MSERGWRGRRRGKRPDNWQGASRALSTAGTPSSASLVPGRGSILLGQLTWPASSALSHLGSRLGSRLGSQTLMKIMRVRRCLLRVSLEDTHGFPAMTSVLTGRPWANQAGRCPLTGGGNRGPGERAHRRPEGFGIQAPPSSLFTKLTEIRAVRTKRPR